MKNIPTKKNVMSAKDILALAEYFLAKFAERNEIAVSDLTPDASRRTAKMQPEGKDRSLNAYLPWTEPASAPLNFSYKSILGD
jgi:transcriptional regulator of aromatic amino acid metabolism